MCQVIRKTCRASGQNELIKSEVVLLLSMKCSWARTTPAAAALHTEKKEQEKHSHYNHFERAGRSPVLMKFASAKCHEVAEGPRQALALFTALHESQTRTGSGRL